MTRYELSAILLDLYQRKAITLDEMALTLARYDAGELVDLPTSAPPTTTNDQWIVALALLLLLLNRSKVGRLNQRERTRARQVLRKRYENRVVQLAVQVSDGGSIATWRDNMQLAITDYSIQMAVAGAGALPSPVVSGNVDARLSVQWPFLAAFAVQIMARGLAGRAMGALWIAQRSRLYGGSGWASFHEAQGSVAMPGYVDVWVTRDDPNVCPLCSPRHQRYFLPTQGPWPGDAFQCLGDCRCRRIPEYLPNVYADLSGHRSSQIHPMRRRVGVS